MALLQTADYIILGLIAICSLAYFYWTRKPTVKRTKKLSFVQNIIDSSTKNHLILFYGSQTGTAEDLAIRFAQELAENYGVSTSVCDFEDYDPDELQNWPNELEIGKKLIAAFFMATYGEGEPTDNAADFYEWFMNGGGKCEDEGDQEDDKTATLAFSNITYILFGLGNKTYEHFNALVRRMDKRFRSCGAKLLGLVGEGDDDASLEEDYLKWKAEIIPLVAAYFDVKAVDKRKLPHVPIFNLVNLGPDANGVDSSRGIDAPYSVFHGEFSHAMPRRWTAVSNETGVKLVEASPVINSKPLFINNTDVFKFDSAHNIGNECISGHSSVSSGKVEIVRQCYHIELDISNTNVKYNTGDHVGIWGTNDELEVLKLSRLLGIQDKLDDVISLKPNPENVSSSNTKLPFPVPCSIRTALTHYLDLRAHVKQHHLEIFAKYTTNESDKQALLSLADNRDEFVSKIEKPQKTVADILDEFSSVSLPLQVILAELLPKMAVRYYSISSSSKMDPTVVGITAVVVRYALSTVKRGDVGVVVRKGLVTSFLERMHISVPTSPISGDKLVLPKTLVPMYIRASTFKLPADPSIPIIMVGPGTGVAPFRAFLWDRMHARQSGKQVGSTWLFYGCRNPDSDWLYRDEMQSMLETVKDIQGFDFRIHVAFSRVSDKKEHQLAQYKEFVWDVLEKQRGYFYVCGDAKNMAREVQNVLVGIAADNRGQGEDAGKAWLKELRSKGRYLEDVWS